MCGVAPCQTARGTSAAHELRTVANSRAFHIYDATNFGHDACKGVFCRTCADTNMSDNPHVLLVDDDENIRLAFRLFFLDTQFVMDEAASAKAAYRQLAANRYDLVISDIRLGGESGVTLCTHIKGTHPETPVIIITGYPELIDEAKARSCGASCVLLKPLDLSRLRAAIGECLSAKDMVWRS